MAGIKPCIAGGLKVHALSKFYVVLFGFVLYDTSSIVIFRNRLAIAALCVEGTKQVVVHSIT